ncbi:hypothetical protein C8T65DRAFT_629000 [Cerioporus squamosus]|nr:hypothetical protein C8T65DRAFT_629000 [Cerioporus squamosus]
MKGERVLYVVIVVTRSPLVSGKNLPVAQMLSARHSYSQGSREKLTARCFIASTRRSTGHVPRTIWLHNVCNVLITDCNRSRLGNTTPTHTKQKVTRQASGYT